MRDGYCFKYDVSLPLSKFYEIIEALRERLTSPNVKRINGFGHLGKRLDCSPPTLPPRSEAALSIPLEIACKKARYSFHLIADTWFD